MPEGGRGMGSAGHGDSIVGGGSSLASGPAPYPKSTRGTGVIGVMGRDMFPLPVKGSVTCEHSVSGKSERSVSVITESVSVGSRGVHEIISAWG